MPPLVDEEIVRLALAGHMRAQELSANHGAGHVVRIGSVVRVAFNKPDLRPDYMYIADDLASTWAAAGEQLDAARSEDRRVLVLVNDRIRVAAQEGWATDHGLAYRKSETCMARLVTADAVTLDVPHGVDLLPVDGTEAYAEAIDTSARVFDASPDLFALLYPPSVVDSGSIRLVRAHADGRTVGVASASVDAPGVGVYGVAVDAAYRRRGIGEALTRWTCVTGAQAGARFAYLQPSEMGEGLYRRMGFEEVGGYRMYV